MTIGWIEEWVNDGKVRKSMNAPWSSLGGQVGASSSVGVWAWYGTQVASLAACGWLLWSQYARR